jgi:hypothetical protein
MSISNNKSKITNETNDEVGIRSINSEVASTERYVHLQLRPCRDELDPRLKLRDSGHL